MWIALWVVGLWVAYGDKNVARKKRLLPFFIVGSGTIFGVFALIVIGDLRALALIAPAIGLIIFLNLRQLKVCPTCGRTINSGRGSLRRSTAQCAAAHWISPDCEGGLIGETSQLHSLTPRPIIIG